MGYDTAPMEGFMEDQVKVLLKIPERVRVVALLAVGRLKGKDKLYAGRFEPARSVFADAWGKSIDF
jgi:nitroreductase